MLLYPPRILRRCCYTRLEYYGDVAISILGGYSNIFARLEYYGDVAIPAKNTTEMLLYPPRILRRCCYTRLEYYGDDAIPA